MKLVFRSPMILTLGVLLTSTACAPLTPAETALPSMAVATFTPLATARPTGTSTLSTSATLEPTLESTSTGVASDIVLPGWVPEGARARIGRGVISQIALSPDGKTIAVAGATGLSLLTADTFEEVWSVPTSKEMTNISFSPDGKTLTSLSFRIVWGLGSYILDEAYIWDASSGQNLRSIPVQGSDEEELIFALSQDGQTLAITNYHTMGQITIWDLATGQIRRTLDSSRFQCY